MYWWNTKKLAEEIKNGKLSEKQKKSYYIATSVIYLLSVYVITASPAANPMATLIEALSITTITIIGINITFKSNKGNEGIDFIGRSLALSFPILMKLIAIGFIQGLCMGVSSELLGSETIDVWATLAFGIIIQTWYFWRLNIHLKTINT